MSFSGGDDIQQADNIVTVENITRLNMVVTAKVKKDIMDEVDQAVELHAKSINEDNSGEIFAFRQHRGDIVWSVKTCNKCNRPTYWSTQTLGETDV
jgi:hypothetical protein